MTRHKGPPCPRCGYATEVRRHSEITAQRLRQPFFYSHWYICHNTRCRTTNIMPEEAKVWNNPEAVPGVLRAGDDVVLDVLRETADPWDHVVFSWSDIKAAARGMTV